MEAENVTLEQRLVAECERLDAKFAGDDAAGAGLTRQELIARFIARKMVQFGVTDGELRRTVTTMVTRKYDEMFTCCDKVWNRGRALDRVQTHAGHSKYVFALCNSVNL